MQLSEIFELLVNQKPAKPLSQLEILEITFVVDAQIKIQAQTPKSPQHPKSHLKSRISPQNPKSLPPNPQILKKELMLQFLMFWFDVVVDVFLTCLRDVSSETLIGGLCWETKSDVWFDVCCWNK